MKTLNIAVKRAIVLEYARCKNITKVATKLNVSRTAVRRWVSRFEKSGQLQNAHKSGRKCVIDKAVAERAVDMLLSGDHSGAAEVARQLHTSGLTNQEAAISRTTLVRHAKAVAKANGAPIHAVQGAPKKELTRQTKQQRLQFCKRNLRRTWKNVMFTDRKKFYFFYPGVKINKVSWVRKGQRRTALKVNHAMCVNLYAGITPFGPTKPHLVAGTSKMKVSFTNQKGVQARNITTAEYEQVMMTLLKEGKKLFGAQGITSWVFQQDNDPAHKRACLKVMEGWKKGANGCHVSLLPQWPANSPDLSPIENVWFYIQQKVNAAGCKTFEEFQKKVIVLLKKLPKRILNNLYGSMRARLLECIEKDGGKTHY